MGKLFLKIIEWLYDHTRIEEKEKVSRSDMLKDYYNEKYPSVPIFYSGRLLYGTDKRFEVDVRNFFTLNDERLHQTVKSLKMGSQTDNQKAITCLKWIIENIAYISDKKQFGMPEHWDFPFETLSTMKNDCEGGTILLANLLLIAGVPNWKVRINCGLVFEPISKKQIGHAYLTFFDEDIEQWKILDWSFYPTLKRISEREEYKKETMYQDIWFSFNDVNSWSANQGDVRKMEGF